MGDASRRWIPAASLAALRTVTNGWHHSTPSEHSALFVVVCHMARIMPCLLLIQTLERRDAWAAGGLERGLRRIEWIVGTSSSRLFVYRI